MATDEFDQARCLERVRQQDQDAARALVEQLYPLVICGCNPVPPRRVISGASVKQTIKKL